MSDLLMNYQNGEYSESFQKMMDKAIHVIKKQNYPPRKKNNKSMEKTYTKFGASILPKIHNPKTANNNSKNYQDAIILDNYFSAKNSI